MPAQGQKSWDTATRFQESFRRLSQCLPRGRNPGTTGKARARCGRASSQCLPRGRNPGTTYPVVAVALGVESQCLPRGRNPGTCAVCLSDGGRVSLSQCLPRGRNPGTRYRQMVAACLRVSQCLPRGRNPGTTGGGFATRQLYTDRNACPGAEILGRVEAPGGPHGHRGIAMPAQGQKSWDASRSARAFTTAARRNACPGAEILGRG